MKTPKELLLFVIMLLCISIQAQEYKSLSFKNYSPKWIHASIDSSLIGQLDPGIAYNGYNHIAWAKPPIILYPFAFVVHERVPIAREGAFIEKLDLRTGKSTESTFYDLRNNDTKEIPSFVYLNNDKELEILNFRKNDTFPFIWAWAVLSKFKFNTSDLSLIDHDYADGSDSTVHVFRVSGGGGLSNRSIYPYDDKETYVFNYNFPYYTIGASLMNSSGQLVKDTLINRHIPFFPNNSKTVTSKMFRISQDSFMNFNHAINEAGDTSLGYFEYFDRELNSIGLYDITTDLKPSIYYFPTKVTKDHIILFAEEYLDLHGLKRRYYNYNGSLQNDINS